MRASVLFLLLITLAWACSPSETAEEYSPSLPTPDGDNGGIVLPDNFGALVVADTLGRGRHIVVNENGDIYVRLARLAEGKGIMALRDTSGDGRADIIQGYADSTRGTAINIYNGYLYYSSPRHIFRSTMNEGQLLPSDSRDTLVTFPEETTKGHYSKSFIFDRQGNMYVNIGSRSNACQKEARTKGSPGIAPCPEIPNRAAIWVFKDNQLGQLQSDGEAYATGIRNTVGLDWNFTNNKLYVMQHGRDDLFRFWPEYYNDKQSRDIPAEEFLMLEKGDDFGWPYCYYDPFQSKKLLCPEYGGDGQKQGRCEGIKAPLVAFPGHYGPNDLFFYTGDQFPERYKNGAFIAFHGSWNRINHAQAGYMVAFVPMQDGQPSGDWEIFADGFIGADTISSPGKARFRPCGLAQGSDGSLYISDSQKGRVWRVIYYGENSGITSQPQEFASNTSAATEEVSAELAAGKNLYDLHCRACHMDNGSGVSGMNPPLAGTDWVTGDKQRLINVLLKGMSEPVEIKGETYQNIMASFAYLKDEEISEILTYVRQSFGNEASAVSVAEVANARGSI